MVFILCFGGKNIKEGGVEEFRKRGMDDGMFSPTVS